MKYNNYHEHVKYDIKYLIYISEYVIILLAK